MAPPNAMFADPKRSPRLRRGAAWLLQIAGLAATNRVLTAAAEWLPGFNANRLQGDLDLFAGASASDLADAFLWLAVIPGVGEELIFRGALFAILLRISSPSRAIAASALAFGVVHLDPHHVLIATGLGLQLGALRHAYGLLLAIAAHVANNGLVLLARFVDESGAFDAPELAPETLSLAVALVLAGSACADLRWRLRNAGASPTPDRSPLQTAREEDE